jgi:hypothetical protein
VPTITSEQTAAAANRFMMSFLKILAEVANGKESRPDFIIGGAAPGFIRKLGRNCGRS